MTFLDMLRAAERQNGSMLCVGLDPEPTKFPDRYKGDANKIYDFCAAIVDATADLVSSFKPQIAYFAAHRAEGQLERLMEHIRRVAPHVPIILDAKRGDIGSTMLGYASAWFGDDSPLRSDALTVSGYLGPESLRETLNYAQDVEGGLFVLAATSNPEAAKLQQALIGDHTVSRVVIDTAREIGQGEMGVVIGATQNLKDFGIDFLTEQDIAIPILAPGFGAQGAKLEDLKSIFGASASRVIATMSRELTKNGPEQLGQLIDKAKAKL